MGRLRTNESAPNVDAEHQVEALHGDARRVGEADPLAQRKAAPFAREHRAVISRRAHAGNRLAVAQRQPRDAAGRWQERRLELMEMGSGVCAEKGGRKRERKEREGCPYEIR